MIKHVVLGTCLSLLAAPVVAQQWLGQNNPVANLGGGKVAVINKWAADDQDIWCVAARGALRAGAGWRDRLHVIDVTGARQSQYGAETITFTFRPTQAELAAAKSGSSAARGIGNNLSVNSANRRCQREPDYW